MLIMSGHSDWLMKAARAVEAEFPSLMHIDVHRVVEIAVKTYDDARRNDDDRRGADERPAGMLDLRSRA